MKLVGSPRGAAGEMNQLCRRVMRVKVIRWGIIGRVTVVRDFFRFIWNRLVACSAGPTAVRYRRLPHRHSPSPPLPETSSSAPELEGTSTRGDEFESDLDLVPLKISLLGDGQIGKTSFVVSDQPYLPR